MSNNLKSLRSLSIYEKQQLLKYGLNEVDLLNKGEMPVEYLTGWVDFAGLTLKVNQSVLIPRVETEELVEQALDFLKKFHLKEVRVLDLATGSGAIALALIKQIQPLYYLEKKWKFYLSDVSVKALNLARENFSELLSESLDEDKIKTYFIESDLLTALKPNLQFNLVLANLPYIPAQKIDKLDSSVKNFEPISALDGGKSGFVLIAKALKQLLEKNLIAKNALLLFETDQGHHKQFVKKHFPYLFETFQINFIKDQFGRQRFLALKII
jgi:release factor glutamine methyltransferase